MLATMLADVFCEGDLSSVAEAIADLCEPSDNYGWSSCGIYAFWCPDSRQLLYIGLAKDLPLRFRQHVGLTACDKRGCKVDEVKSYFGSAERLGYTAFVQSRLMQPSCSRGPDYYQGHHLNKVIDREIRCNEGLLIDLWKYLSGSLPAWNMINGGTEGQALSQLIQSGDDMDKLYALYSTPTAISQRYKERLLLALAADYSEELVSRASIRELADDPWLEGHEEIVLHAARMRAITQGISFEDAIDQMRADTDYKSRIESIEQENYLNRPQTF